MPQYLSPGVYVEEVPSAVQPIAGVGTSTAGFIGRVADDVTMPDQPGVFQLNSLGDPVEDSLGNPIPVPYTVADAGAPQLVTSWAQFKTKLGDFQAGNLTLAHAVYGFFNNGGTRCWVAGITEDPTAADAGGAVDAVRKALTKFAAIDEIAIVSVPGAIDRAVQSEVITHCENAGDRFAILDGQQTSTYTAAAVQLSIGDSDYAAMYFPRIQVFDPVSSDDLYVTPSGHVAGIYARVDNSRGVHKAPANEVIRGALGVEERLSRADQDGLNPDGINVIRAFNGNITVWGGRTLGGDANAEWKYINVRRLFLFLRESIDQGTQWVVFEPNEPSLWAKITRNVSAFLTNVWRDGALFGATAQEAFYVKCDHETNPPEVRDLGQVVTEIGVAVVKPAEFVIFRISQWAGPTGG
jgi:hypothetical protein